MRSLIINRDKYLRTRPLFGWNLIKISVLIVVLASTFFLLSVLNKNGGGNGDSVAMDYEQELSLDDSGDEGNTSGQKNEHDGAEDEKQIYSGEAVGPDIIKKVIPENYLVTKVVDGDTIYVSGIKTRIRLIGVNTPETVSSSKPIECFGPEASNYLETLLLNKYVGLESDAAAGDLDGYGRPLRYVYYNGENINQKLILEGYGKEASYGSEYKYRTQFVESEKSAIANNKGLWSSDTCNGLE